MAKFNKKSTLKEILEDERAVAILEEEMPGITHHPMLKEGLEYTVTACVPYASFVGVTVDKIIEIMDEILTLD